MQHGITLKQCWKSS